MKPEPEDGPGPFSAVQHIFSLPLRHTKPAVRHVSWQHIDTHSWQLLVIRLLTASWHAQLGAVSYPSVDSILTDTVDSCQLSVCWQHLGRHSWQLSVIRLLTASWQTQLTAVSYPSVDSILAGTVDSCHPSADSILTDTVDSCQLSVCWQRLDRHSWQLSVIRLLTASWQT